MVYKVCKGGVRSGNTLRGLHSLRTKRYAGQACLVGRSSLPRKEVQRLIERSTEDEDVANTLLNTDVVLSLNKRQRWSLPATVNHLVRSGQFSSSNAMFSVLERHKLRRRANCVGFACNKHTAGVKGQGQGKGQKRYFSFNLDYVDQEESNRQRKKRVAEELKKIVKETKQKVKKDRRTDMQTVVVTTKDGSVPSNNGETLLPSQKPEYRLEVFYPCPQSCSLTFNPKYTDVVMAQNEDGEMEVRPNVKNQKKSQRKHRKRFTARDMNSLNLETTGLEEDVEEMWQESFADTVDDTNISCTGAFGSTDIHSLLSADVPEQSESSSSKHLHRNNFSENIFALLVESAEQARAQWNGETSKTRLRRRSGRHNSGSDAKSNFPNTDLTYLKQHIVNVDWDNGYAVRKDGGRLANENSTLTSPTITESKALPSMPTSTVVLSTVDVTSKALETKFGQRYIEADCLPRRFCIDITDDVTNVLSPGKTLSPSAYTTYVVFVHGGVYDKGSDAYTVMLNCSSYRGTENISYAMPYGLTTIDTIVNVYVGNLLDMKVSGNLTFEDEVIRSKTKNTAPVHEMLMERMKIQVDTFYSSEELWRASQSGRFKERQAMVGGDDEDAAFHERLVKLAEDSEFDVFCEICYESVNIAQSEAAPGTQLKSCGHLFCDACWQTHTRTCMRDGVVRITCPGFRCNTRLEVSTLLSLLHVSEVSQILRRECEDEVETSPSAKWCPSPSCGRVIRLSRRTTAENVSSVDVGSVSQEICFDVVCACGESWCFNCLSPAHWPAGCDQAQVYLDKIESIKPITETSHVDEIQSKPVIPIKPPKPPEVLEVEGRICPKCRRFIEKNGGCPHMSCRCGHQFCWKCMAPYNNHSVCSPKASLVYQYSRRVKVAHLVRPVFTLEDADKDNQQIAKDSTPERASRGRRQKATMYQRALQHRLEAKEAKGWGQAIQEMVTKICRTAGKDLQFKREVLAQCGVASSLIPESTDDLVRLQISDHVARYLRSCQKAMLSLHHVIEFSFVLLQDCPVTSERQRALRVTSDLIGCCSFSQSVISAGAGQDVKTALRRLAEVEAWAKRALDALLATVSRLRVC